MRATREAAEVPSTAKNGGTNDAVAAGESHVLSGGWVRAISELTSEWPDEMDGKLSVPPLSFSFGERVCVPQRPTSSS